MLEISFRREVASAEAREKFAAFFRARLQRESQVVIAGATRTHAQSEHEPSAGTVERLVLSDIFFEVYWGVKCFRCTSFVNRK